jgi:hypothetical protein
LSDSDIFGSSILDEELEYEKKYTKLLRKHREIVKDYEARIEAMGQEIRQLNAVLKKLEGQFVTAKELAGEPAKSADVLDQLF